MTATKATGQITPFYMVPLDSAAWDFINTYFYKMRSMCVHDEAHDTFSVRNADGVQHTFTRGNLNSIDPRIPTLLAYLCRQKLTDYDYWVAVDATVKLWSEPGMTVIDDDTPDGLYLSDIFILEDMHTDPAYTYFDVSGRVQTIHFHEGLPLAYNTGDLRSVDFTYANFDRVYPGKREAFCTAMSLCSCLTEVLAVLEPIAVDCSASMPDDLSFG